MHGVNLNLAWQGAFTDNHGFPWVLNSPRNYAGRAQEPGFGQRKAGAT